MLPRVSLSIVLLAACAVLGAWHHRFSDAEIADATGLTRMARLRGEVLDAGTGKPLPARVYVLGADGSWYFGRSEAKEGSAVEYRKQRGPKSVEMHTTLSAHLFRLDLPPAKYTLTVDPPQHYP